MTTHEQCMNPACERTGTVRLMVFGTFVGMVCQQCSDGLAHRGGALTPDERAVADDSPPPKDTGRWEHLERRPWFKRRPLAEPTGP